jgi:nitronate monooxygenase
VFHDVINIKHAKRAIKAGVDGVILVCHGAGGHAGQLSPFALVQEVRDFYDGTIILSGSIARGDTVLAAQALGADLAYIGTRFIATTEAQAVPDYKQMLVSGTGEDVVYTNLFSGVHGNYLKESVKRIGYDPDNLPVGDKATMNFGSGGNTKAKAWVDIWSAGQGVGQISDVLPAREVVDRLEREYQAAAERVGLAVESRVARIA